MRNASRTSSLIVRSSARAIFSTRLSISAGKEIDRTLLVRIRPPPVITSMNHFTLGTGECAAKQVICPIRVVVRPRFGGRYRSQDGACGMSQPKPYPLLCCRSLSRNSIWKVTSIADHSCETPSPAIRVNQWSCSSLPTVQGSRHPGITDSKDLLTPSFGLRVGYWTGADRICERNPRRCGTWPDRRYDAVGCTGPHDGTAGRLRSIGDYRGHEFYNSGFNLGCGLG